MRAVLLLVALPLAAAPSDERVALAPCSRHARVPSPPGSVVRLFELHKDRNPRNVLVVHTYADSRCRLVGGMEDKGRLIDMYWRMNADTQAECYKPTHPRIKSETLETLDVKSLSADKTRLRIDITPLKQLEHDLPSSEAEVALERDGGVCEAETRLPLKGGEELRLREIDAKGKYRLGVPRRAVERLELKGLDADDRPLSRVYRSK